MNAVSLYVQFVSQDEILKYKIHLCTMGKKVMSTTLLI